MLQNLVCAKKFAGTHVGGLRVTPTSKISIDCMPKTMETDSKFGQQSVIGIESRELEK